MPPLEEEEAIAELDAAIDKAGDEGEEEPKPLDEVHIEEVAHCIEDNPMLHLALGLTDPYWASMALAVGVQKLHEYQAHKNHPKRSQVLSYGKLVNHYGINKDQLQEISVVGKLQQKPKKCKAGQDESGGVQTATRVGRLSHHLKTGHPIDAPALHEILGPFWDHHFVPKVKYLLRSSFYRLSRSHRFNVESLSRFSLTVVKDGTG